MPGFPDRCELAQRWALRDVLVGGDYPAGVVSATAGVFAVSGRRGELPGQAVDQLDRGFDDGSSRGDGGLEGSSC